MKIVEKKKVRLVKADENYHYNSKGSLISKERQEKKRKMKELGVFGNRLKKLQKKWRREASV